MSYYALSMRGGQAVLRSGNAGASTPPAPPGDWVPPIGIPTPTFGLTEVAPAVPDPWTTPTAGFYYVNYQTGDDTGNPYGTPAAPRWTIPRPCPAGAVVEIHGTSYDQNHQSPANIECQGTAEAPVFIRGMSAAAKAICRAKWEMSGTYYILEYLQFEKLDEFSNMGIDFNGPTTYAALRHCDISGNPLKGGIGANGTAGNDVSSLLISDNYIHHNGDVEAVGDQDVHGVGIGRNAHHIWVLDNEMYANSGDGCQVNATSEALKTTTHHIYIGRNNSHGNKQGGAWTKQAQDVIVSQNTFHDCRFSASTPDGAATGFQYGPDRVWFLANTIYNADLGIMGGSDSGGSGEGVYVIGNVIYTIHPTGVSDPLEAWSSAGVMLNGGGGGLRYVINNTIYDVDAGVNTPNASGIVIANNIISTVTVANGNHVFVESATAAGLSSMHHNLLHGTAKIKWGSATVYDLTAFAAAFPGQGGDCVNADPLFVTAGSDFHLQSGSPALNAGDVEDVYATFTTLYGIDIAKDLDGLARPFGAAYDLGAYEQQS